MNLEHIRRKIYEIRGFKVILDFDLAYMYEVETKRLNEAVKRNIRRFPPDFMFQLTKEEWENLKSQFATSSWGGRRKLPSAFTEHGIIMLSSVLNSKIATQIKIVVVKAFIDMRHYIVKPVREKLDNLEKVLMLHIDDTNHNFVEQAAVINEIMDNLNNLIEVSPKQKRKIGFHVND